MTKKRFVAIGVEWTDGFIQDHISDRDLFNIGAVCNLLNELSEENYQLKLDNNRLVNETAKSVAEHQKKVLDLIDEKLNSFDEIYTNGDLALSTGKILLLELKKELQNE